LIILIISIVHKTPPYTNIYKILYSNYTSYSAISTINFHDIFRYNYILSVGVKTKFKEIIKFFTKNFHKK